MISSEPTVSPTHISHLFQVSESPAKVINQYLDANDILSLASTATTINNSFFYDLLEARQIIFLKYLYNFDVSPIQVNDGAPYCFIDDGGQTRLHPKVEKHVNAINAYIDAINNYFNVWKAQDASLLYTQVKHHWHNIPHSIKAKATLSIFDASIEVLELIRQHLLKLDKPLNEERAKAICKNLCRAHFEAGEPFWYALNSHLLDMEKRTFQKDVSLYSKKLETFEYIITPMSQELLGREQWVQALNLFGKTQREIEYFYYPYLPVITKCDSVDAMFAYKGLIIELCQVLTEMISKQSNKLMSLSLRRKDYFFNDDEFPTLEEIPLAMEVPFAEPDESEREQYSCLIL